MGILDTTKETKEQTVGEGVPAKTENTEQTGEEKMIVMDGPLSKVYTEALQVAFAKNAPAANSDGVNVASEEMTADGGLVKTVIASLLDNDYVKETKPATYVYVTDTNKIEDTSAAEVFDKVSKAIANENIKEICICIETIHSVGTHAGLISSAFSSNQKVKFFYNKNKLTNHLLGN